MSRTERTKGAAGEREVAAMFRAHGFDCSRTPNSGGLRLKGDLMGDARLPHLETKWQDVWRLPLWIAQAERECDGRPWVVAFRANRTPWYAALPLGEYARLLADAEALALALAFYAEPDSWEPHPARVRPTVSDGGDLARAALAARVDATGREGA